MLTQFLTRAHNTILYYAIIYSSKAPVDVDPSPIVPLEKMRTLSTPFITMLIEALKRVGVSRVVSLFHPKQVGQAATNISLLITSF